MAERRMFAKTIIDSDAFLDMPISTQALYFHLSMRADDDGFINNAKKIQRMIGCSDDDLKILLSKNFVIPFESGVCVIKHWKIHNLIQKDRYKPSVYLDEKAKLYLKNNNVYTMDTNCIHDVSSLDSQVRVGKGSLVKSSVGEVSETGSKVIELKIANPPPPTNFTYSSQKFSMYGEWTPSDSFETLAKIAGMKLGDDYPVDEFLEFRTYWVTQPAMQRTQGEWEHSFIKSYKTKQMKGVKK
jgi:hypothetical protein